LEAAPGIEPGYRALQALTVVANRLVIVLNASRFGTTGHIPYI
jgi:hypothetical protein